MGWTVPAGKEVEVRAGAPKAAFISESGTPPVLSVAERFPWHPFPTFDA